MLNHLNKVLRKDGYVSVYCPDHPKNSGGQVLEHILVAEKALRRYLPDKVEVHHVDFNRANNSPNNLVICENNTYHKLLHRRSVALKITDNPNARKCKFCKLWEVNLETGYIWKYFIHRECSKKRNAKNYDKIRKRHK